jgi:hypoxanthine phosphoribosyltransferase
LTAPPAEGEGGTGAVRTLFTPEEIATRVEALAGEIAASRPENLLVVIVLKGGFVFGADLVRAMSRAGVAMEIEFISLSSYGASTRSSGEVRVVRDIEVPVSGRDVLLLDDVLDSGLTLKFARDLLVGRRAARVLVAAMIDKPAGRVAEIEGDYVGFTCPDYFVVGYGMDAAHAYRELPMIGVLEAPEAGAEDEAV